MKLKPVWTLDKKGLAAMTSSLSAAIKAMFGNYDVVHFMQKVPVRCCGFRSFSASDALQQYMASIGSVPNGAVFASKYIKFGEKVAAKYADEIIVLSEGVQRYFKNTYSRKTVFIPNGVNKPIVREPQVIKEKFELDKDSYILFLGRLVPEKGISYLIEAFKQINTDKKLVIAGGSSDTDEFLCELKKLAKDDERILFTGLSQGQLLEELYSNAYVYALPSDLEGMPLSLLEAMSYGNCCVVSDIAECTEVVEDKAVVFSKSNVEQLKDKLQDLCAHPEKVKLYKESASDFICQKYNWDDVVNRTVALYYRVN